MIDGGIIAISRRGVSVEREVPRYRWSIMLCIAVAFWNVVGAASATSRIALSPYYMQAPNFPPLYGQAPLFGVCGMLGIGLVLFCRGLKPELVWNEGLLSKCFWSLNSGFALIAALAMLPIGTIPPLAAIEHGYVYVRPAEFMHRRAIELVCGCVCR